MVHLRRSGLAASAAFACLLLLLASLALPARAQYVGASDASSKSTNIRNMVEFYNPWLGHYFITAIGAEIEALDAGLIPGWARTGEKFEVWDNAGDFRIALYRFFSNAFAPKSSHFYTASEIEFALLLAGPVWLFEGLVAYVERPNPDGSCNVGKPVFRVYNNLLSGAPNHRYIRSETLRNQMILLGWISEGYGLLGVIFCVPRE